MKQNLCKDFRILFPKAKISQYCNIVRKNGYHCTPKLCAYTDKHVQYVVSELYVNQLVNQ